MIERAPRIRVQRRPVHGVLLLDKPLGLSSNNALQKVKWLLRAEKAGHTGTLDPLATGVLPLCFGAATKFSALQLDAPKTYEAVALLGITTSTAMPEARCWSTARCGFSDADLQRVAMRFTGPIVQLPPMYSALKRDGRPLYEYARAGIEVARTPRSVTIHDLQLRLEQQDGEPVLRMLVGCSKGTYIPTLAQDIGEALGAGAHLTQLRLDPVNRALLRSLINEQHEKGRTIIFSTHAMYEAEQLCDHLLMIHDGQKVLDLSMQELYRKYDPKTLIVEPADAAEQERVLGSLRHLNGVDSARLSGETIELKLNEGTDASSVIAAAASACRVRRMELKRASVEEIFIDIVKGSGGSGEELEELRASLAQARLDTGEVRDSA